MIQTIVKQLKEHAEAARKGQAQQKRQQPGDEKRSMPTTNDRFHTPKEQGMDLGRVKANEKKKEVVEDVLQD